MEAQIQQLEQRATNAESELKQLHSQIEQQKNQDQVDAQQFTQSVLKQLQHLRGTLAKEQKEASEAVAQKKDLVKQRDELKTENEKLRYRINILLRSLEEAESKNN